MKGNTSSLLTDLVEQLRREQAKRHVTPAQSRNRYLLDPQAEGIALARRSAEAFRRALGNSK